MSNSSDSSDSGDDGDYDSGPEVTIVRLGPTSSGSWHDRGLRERAIRVLFQLRELLGDRIEVQASTSEPLFRIDA